MALKEGHGHVIFSRARSYLSYSNLTAPRLVINMALLHKPTVVSYGKSLRIWQPRIEES